MLTCRRFRVRNSARKPVYIMHVTATVTLYIYTSEALGLNFGQLSVMLTKPFRYFVRDLGSDNDFK
jgi:hypothetical protein